MKPLYDNTNLEQSFANLATSMTNDIRRNGRIVQTGGTLRHASAHSLALDGVLMRARYCWLGVPVCVHTAHKTRSDPVVED